MGYDDIDKKRIYSYFLAEPVNTNENVATVTGYVSSYDRSRIILYSNGFAIDLQFVLKIELRLDNGYVYSSLDYPDQIDWMSPPETGVIELKIGLLPYITTRVYMCELVVYDDLDPSYLGAFWGFFRIKVLRAY